MLPAKGVLLSFVWYLAWPCVDAASLKTVDHCYPACTPGRGLCIEGRCFCRSPYGGATCADIVYKPTEKTPNRAAPQHLSGAAPHRHTLHAENHEDDADNANDDANSGLDLFGVGDEAAEHTGSASEDSADASLHVETGELGSRQSSVQQANDDDKSDAPSEDASDETQKEQAPLVEHFSLLRKAVEAVRVPAIAPPAQRHPPETTTTGAVQAEGKGIWQWSKLFRSAMQTSGLATRGPKLETRQEHSSHHDQVRDHSSLRRHRKHKERKLLFASSEPAFSVTDGAASGNQSCVPWLAELRSEDLYNLTTGKAGNDQVDMKTTRLAAYQKRVAGGHAGLMKSTFLQSLSKWYKGPTHAEGLALFDKLDITGDGMLSFEEYNWENACGYRGALLSALAAEGKSWSQGFSFIDKNSDGSLTQEEFVEKSIGTSLGLSSGTALDVFKFIDSDTSGSVNRTEFEILGGLPRLRVQVAEKEPDQSAAFKQADSNKDGYLDEAEFTEHAQDMGDFHDRSAVLPVLHELDKNKDGNVEKDEYVNKCWIQTGGFCSENRCQRWRGPASCSSVRDGPDRPCVCAPGYCAKNGACIPEELHASMDSLLGPAAGHMLDKLHEVDADSIFDKFFQGSGNTDAAEGVVAVMLTITIMIQLKAAFQSFPFLGVLVFNISVGAFYLVTSTCFRSFSVPDSIENASQMLVLIALYCALTISVTSLTRIWAPPHARIPAICWYITDDKDEYGLSKNEELKVQAYNYVFLVMSLLCAVGLYEAPLEGVHSVRTKFMLVMLYVCIIVLDMQLLQNELRECAARRYMHEVHVCQVTSIPGQSKPAIQMATIPGLAAWWNEMLLQRHLWQYRDVVGLTDRLDAYHEDQISNVSILVTSEVRTIQDTTKRFSKFATVRIPVSDLGRQPTDQQRQVQPKSNELFYLSNHGALCGHYVNGRVVVMWEDTEIEFAWKSDSFLGSHGGSPWRTFEALELDGSPDGSKESQVLRELPGVMIGAGNTGQTLQQKMLILTQAGASGLIIGQRGPSNLSADTFHLNAEPPDTDDYGSRKSVWRGAYHVKKYGIVEQGFDSKVVCNETRDAFTRYDFTSQWLGNAWKQLLPVFFDQSNTQVEDGVAINTFLVNSMDMQELAWSLEERKQDSGYDMKEQQRAQPKRGRGGLAETDQAEREVADQSDLGTASVMYAAFSKRPRPACSGEINQTKAFGGFQLPATSGADTNLHAGLSKVVAQQHQMMRNVVAKEHDSMEFLRGVRNWVKSLWFIKWTIWQHIHLVLSGAALVFVVDMSELMFNRIHLNEFGMWADLLVVCVMVLNGQNIAIHVQWYPFNPRNLQDGGFGVVFTAVVTVAYYGAILFLCCSNGLRRIFDW